MNRVVTFTTSWRSPTTRSPAAIRPDDYHPNTLATEIARRGRLPLSDCLQLGLALTRAVAELHKNGLVHRDIKPGNIIFVDGMSKLGDIGLVTGVNDTLSFVGTAGFMAPEGPGRTPPTSTASAWCSTKRAPAKIAMSFP